MSAEHQTAIEVDADKGQTEPLTGGSPSKIVFTPDADGKNEAKVEFTGPAAISSGLTKEELMKYANDPTWTRVRYGVLIMYWVTWFAMFAGSVVIIATSTRCPSKD